MAIVFWSLKKDNTPFLAEGAKNAKTFEVLLKGCRRWGTNPDGGICLRYVAYSHGKSTGVHTSPFCIYHFSCCPSVNHRSYQLLSHNHSYTLSYRNLNATLREWVGTLLNKSHLNLKYWSIQEVSGSVNMLIKLKGRKKIKNSTSLSSWTPFPTVYDDHQPIFLRN